MRMRNYQPRGCSQFYRSIAASLLLLILLLIHSQRLGVRLGLGVRVLL
jgi:hypothetical protein